MKILFPLTLLASFVCLSCDREDSADTLSDSKDSQIAELREKLKTLNKKLEDEDLSGARKKVRYESSMASLKERVETLDNELKATPEKKSQRAIAIPLVEPPAKPAEELEKMARREIEALRGAAVGETYEELTLNFGKLYHEVKITGVDDIGLRFSHRNGAARIDYMSLPKAWKERFHFDVGQFLEARNTERLAQLRWEKAVDEKLAMMREEEREIAEKRRKDDLALALAEANRPVQTTRVTPPARTVFASVNSSRYFLNRRSNSSYYSTPYRSSRICLPSTGYRPSLGVYRPTVRAPVRSTAIRFPVIRASSSYQGQPQYGIRR